MQQNITLLLLLALCTLNACYEPKKACLDVEAENFDATADENCCCQYPKLIFKLQHRYTGLNSEGIWVPDSVVTNNLGQAFKFNVSYYLSESAITQNANERRPVGDISLPVFFSPGGDTSKTFANNIMLVRRSPTDYTLGEFPFSGAFQKVSLQLGLSAAVQEVNPNRITIVHPLRNQPERLWRTRNEGFVNMLVTVGFPADVNTRDTLRFFRSDFERIPITKEGTFQGRRGFNTEFKITADYAELFKDIDLSKINAPEIKKRMTTNLKNVFSVTQ
jgi:hypothetical protein